MQAERQDGQIRFLNAEGARLEYRLIESRAATAPTLVLLHEGLGCVDAWGRFPERLSQRTGLPVFVYSRQGYGRSDPASAPRPVSYLHHEALRVLPRVLEAGGIEQYLLFGHSDGASIALIHAGEPAGEGLLGVIAVAPHVLVEDCVRPAIERTRHAFEHGLLRERLARLHGDNTEGAFYGWCRTWLAPVFCQWNIEPFLESIRVPLLTIQGTDDEYATWRQVEAIRARIDSEVLQVRAGHFPHRDEEEVVLDATAAFVRSDIIS